MTAEERRAAIAQTLRGGERPLSAGALARTYGVSRQVIVGDIALLRAAGEDIASTPRGYLGPRPHAGVLRTVACRHSAARLEQELNLIVDHGCTAVDVAVEHPVYGQLSGRLEISTRADVRAFVRRVQEEGAKPLSVLTDGVHLHTLRCPDGEAADALTRALDREGFLVKG